MNPIPRSVAAALGQQTRTLVGQGRYRSPEGRTVHIGHLVRDAVSGTVEFPPDADLRPVETSVHDTRIEVANTDTLAASRTLQSRGHHVVALNFASAKRPGGGWLGGSRAQEESLARSSALAATLEGRRYYDVHRQQADPMYTHHAIHSPAVPVFRTHTGELLEVPWTVAFLTCAAVNAKVVLERDRSRRAEIADTMAERIEHVLHIAAHLGHDGLVLGAWGCGAFRNDADMVATAFHDALHGPFRGTFAAVTFAILDRSGKRRFLGPFAQAFGVAAT